MTEEFCVCVVIANGAAGTGRSFPRDYLPRFEADVKGAAEKLGAAGSLRQNLDALRLMFSSVHQKAEPSEEDATLLVMTAFSCLRLQGVAFGPLFQSDGVILHLLSDRIDPVHVNLAGGSMDDAVRDVIALLGNDEGLTH